MILSVGTNETNLAYFREMPDSELLFRYTEAKDIWFMLLMREPHKDYVEEHLGTVAFWECNMNTIELILKERNIFSDPKFY